MVCLIITIPLILVSVFIEFEVLKSFDRMERDKVRREFAEMVNVEIKNYFSNNSKYPEVLKLMGVVRLNSQKIETISTTRVTRSIQNESMLSSEIGTVYCFKNLGNSYAFGVKLESGEWLQLGDVDCNEENAVK